MFIVLFTSCIKEKIAKSNISTDSKEVSVCEKVENISFSKDLLPIINNRCIGCHDVESSIKLYDYNSVLQFSQSGQLVGCLTGDTNYLQMYSMSKIDSCEQKVVLLWIKEGMQEN